MPKKYASIIDRYASEFGVDETEIFAIIETESKFNKDAKSSAGAIGLMQIMPDTGRWIATTLGIEFEINELFDPNVNVRFGAFYLSYLHGKFSEDWVVYASYNAGEGVVSRWVEENIKKDEIPYAETKNYVQKVFKAKKYFGSKKFAANH